MTKIHVSRLRAVRRHHRARLLKRWTAVVKYTMYSTNAEPDPGMVDRIAHLRVKTRKPCSCFICNSFRRWVSGPTRQELLDQLACQEQLSQLHNHREAWLDDYWLDIPFYGEDLDPKQLANEGFNFWLASLPQDEDWGDSYDRATPVHWDEELNAFVED